MEARPFTVRENARCQTFLDDWEFCGNISSQYKQVGNAVPVNLALGICCTGCYQKKTRGYNVLRCINNETFEKKDMTSFMNQIGIVGKEFKTVRFNLVKKMNKGRMVA